MKFVCICILAMYITVGLFSSPSFAKPVDNVDVELSVNETPEVLTPVIEEDVIDENTYEEEVETSVTPNTAEESTNTKQPDFWNSIIQDTDGDFCKINGVNDLNLLLPYENQSRSIYINMKLNPSNYEYMQFTSGSVQIKDFEHNDLASIMLITNDMVKSELQTIKEKGDWNIGTTIIEDGYKYTFIDGAGDLCCYIIEAESDSDICLFMYSVGEYNRDTINYVLSMLELNPGVYEYE